MGLIGRTRELTVITAGLTRAEGGVGGIVVVVGPRGAGKSAVAAAAVGVARGRGFRVLQVARVAGQRDGVVWAQLLSSAGVDQDIAGTMLAPPSALTSDTAVQALITAGPQLLVVEDVDATGMDVAMVSLLAGRVTASGTLVLVTARSPFGFGTTLTLRGLGLPDTGRLRLAWPPMRCGQCGSCPVACRAGRSTRPITWPSRTTASIRWFIWSCRRPRRHRSWWSIGILSGCWRPRCHG